MTALVSALTRRALPNLGVGKAKAEGIRSWLSSGSFIVDATSPPNQLCLKNISVSEFLAFQLFDFQRFAFSSLETMAFCKPDKSRPRAISWPLLKAYYAGFFGGHALLRAVGQGIIRIESIQANKLSTLGEFYRGAPYIVSVGTYDLRIKQNSDGSVDVFLYKIDDAGGAHETFWRRFNLFLSEVGAEVVNNSEPDATAALTKITELQLVLTGNGSSVGSWLSQIRNRINYQHQYEVWFPFGAAEKDIKYFADLKCKHFSSGRLDYDHKKQTLQAFASGCLVLASLNFDVTNQIAKASSGGVTGFAKTWERLTIDLKQQLS